MLNETLSKSLSQTPPIKRLVFSDDSYIRPAVNPANGWYDSKTDQFHSTIEAALSERLLFLEKK